MIVRQEKIASEIRKILSVKLLKTPAFLTILKVKLNTDLSVAKIHFSLFGQNRQCDETLKFLASQKKNLRKEIGHQIKLRAVPELQWIRDDTLEHADQINRLIKNISLENK